jgi:lysozyme
MAGRVLWQRTRVPAGVVLALALIALLFWLFAATWRPASKDFPVQGIDVAEAQGPIDWWTVKTNPDIQFAYARATIGARGRDKRFLEYWRALFETGIPHGAFHVFSLCQLSADQAGNFVAAVPRHPEQLPVAVELDFDSSCAARPARPVVLGEISHFLTVIEKRSGKRAVLKIARRFEDYYRVSQAIQRPLWSVQAFFPPSYFDKPWTMWQASSYRRIEGVSGAVNWDVMAQ